MNSKHHRLIGILILLLGLVASYTVLAEVTSITSANPDSAAQGALAEPIKIKGSGFDKTVKEVKFLLPCTGEFCTGADGGITVTNFKVIDAENITATIDVSDTAELGSFYIAMTIRGRGGKGTTFKSANLFTVELRPNQTLVSCDEIIEAPLGSCTCMFSWDGNENIYGLLENCVTSETLKLKSMIRTAGSVQASGTERLSITAVPCGSAPGQDCTQVGVGNFSGSSVIENWFHRARVRYLDIVIGPGVSDGCNGGDFQSAISFVLRADTPDPKTTLPQDAPDPINRNSLFFVSDNGIYTEAKEPLCKGIEVIRTQGYTDLYSYSGHPQLARDWKIIVDNNEISPRSYVEAGIVMLGMMPSESINPPKIVGNTVFEAACGDQNSVGILFGDLTYDPENQVDGLVEGNTIDLTSSCSPEPTGVLVVGDADDIQTTAKINKNEISGAFIGVDVDCNVVDVNFSGNRLNGASVTGDTGILSDAQSTSTKGKPNKIVDYTTKINTARLGCQ